MLHGRPCSPHGTFLTESIRWKPFDADCIERDINPGSIADIIIASIYIALGRGLVMGLLRSGINEVIATTSFNAAPMGIHYRGGKGQHDPLHGKSYRTEY